MSEHKRCRKEWLGNMCGLGNMRVCVCVGTLDALMWCLGYKERES